MSNNIEKTVNTILKTYHTIAVVGLSPKHDRASWIVANYMKEHGYKIVPVRPGINQILDEKCYKSLTEIPFDIDVVDIFRKPEAVALIVDEAIDIGAKAVWLQLGITNEKAEEKARKKGLLVVSDKCMKIELANIDNGRTID